MGRCYWQRRIDDHPASHVIGAPAFYEDRLYVPVSSLEEGQGGNAAYECCTFRGSVVALDAGTGAVIWKTHTIEGEPRVDRQEPRRRAAMGTVGRGNLGARRRSIRNAASSTSPPATCTRSRSSRRATR